MALVVETGSGTTPSANSYADLAFIRAYNIARGRVEIEDADDDELNAQAIQAMDFIEAQEADMKGERVYGAAQPLSFPRNNVVLFGDTFANDAIPIQLKNAQAELTWQVSSGVNLFPTTTGQAVKRKKTGPLEKEFFAPPELPWMPAVDQWLSMLLVGQTGMLRVVRV